MSEIRHGAGTGDGYGGDKRRHRCLRAPCLLLLRGYGGNGIQGERRTGSGWGGPFWFQPPPGLGHQPSGRLARPRKQSGARRWRRHLFLLLALFFLAASVTSSLSFRRRAMAAHKASNPLRLHTDIAVFVYQLPDKFNRAWLRNERCGKQLFAAEVALHATLESSPVRTTEPELADFFFLPVYLSCNFSTKSGFPTLASALYQLRSAVQLVSRDFPYWRRNGGRDHVFVASHDFGACFHASEAFARAAGIPAFINSSIILQTFGQEGAHPCQHHANSIQIPSYVHLQDQRSDPQLLPQLKRDIWAFFRGKMEIHPRNSSAGSVYSRGVRTVLWRKFGHDKRFFIKRKRSDAYQSEMLRSVFCICPLGWAPWSPRIVEAVVFGCVPVIIADRIALPFSHVLDWPRISLRLPEKQVHQLDKVLEEVSATNLSKIQQQLWKPHNSRALLYHQPALHGDASWQILDLLARSKQARAASHASPK